MFDLTFNESSVLKREKVQDRLGKHQPWKHCNEKNEAQEVEGMSVLLDAACPGVDRG